MKRCADCETVKPLADYTRRPCGRPVAYCKPCTNARWKRYRMALAHTIKDKTELAKRRELMEAWAAYLHRASSLPGRARAAAKRRPSPLSAAQVRKPAMK